MECIAGAICLILVLWACSGSRREKPRYQIEETSDSRYFEVIDSETGKIEFVGTHEACEMWIKDRE